MQQLLQQLSSIWYASATLPGPSLSFQDYRGRRVNSRHRRVLSAPIEMAGQVDIGDKELDEIAGGARVSLSSAPLELGVSGRHDARTAENARARAIIAARAESMLPLLAGGATGSCWSSSCWRRILRGIRGTDGSCWSGIRRWSRGRILKRIRRCRGRILRIRRWRRGSRNPGHST